MARIAKNLTELVGNTPLLEFSNFNASKNLRARVVGKLEYFNPAGSVKDRIALAMIEDAETRGVLKPGATIIEPTSGNTGVGLAFVSSSKGYNLILTMPDTMSVERRNLLKALGAQLVLTPGVEGMKGRVVLEQLKQEMKILGVICEFSLLQLVFIRTYQIAQHIHCPLHATYIFVYKFGKRAVRFSEFVSWVLRTEPKLIHYGNE